MTDPAVSVVMPVHNAEAHVGDAVRSVLAQRFEDFELVVCNDGSTDRTASIVAALAESDPRIRVVSRPVKSGVAAAANWAVSEARAPLVAIAHGDDLSHPDRLARQVAIMDARPDCVLSGAPADAIDWHGRWAHPPNLWRLARPGPFAPMAHSSILFRKAAFEQAGGYDSAADYWEDLHLFWRMAAIGTILVSPHPLTTYRYSRSSIRQRDAALRVESALETMYRSAERIAAGEPAQAADPAVPSRLHPRIFVACSWSRVWAGERAILLGQLLTRGRLRWNRDSLASLGFVIWATLSPKSLRAALRLATVLRNRWARRLLGRAEWVEWSPLRGHQAS